MSEVKKKSHRLPLKGAFLSLLLAFTFIALSFSPVVQPARAETDWAVVGAGATIGAVSGGVIGGLMFDGPGAVAGAVVGGVWGAIAGWLAQDKGAAAFLDAKEAYATTLQNITTNYMGIASAGADNVINTYDMQTYFFARKAEWAALQLYDEQTNASQAHVYNPYYVLSRSEVANGTMAAEWAIATQYEAIFNQYKDQAQSFVGTYDGMAWGYCADPWNSYPTCYESTLSSHPTQIMKILIGMGAPTQTGDYAGIAGNNTIYVISTADSNNAAITIKDRAGNVVVNQSFNNAAKDDVMLLTVPVSGDYDISSSTDNVAIYGLFSKSITNSAGFAVQALSFVPKEDGSLKLYGRDLHGIYFSASSGYGPGKRVVDFSGALTKVTAIINKVQSMQTTANSLAQAYYNTLVANGGAGNRIMPDIVFPDPKSLENMTAEQIYAVYLAYLTQQQDWFKNYSVQDPSSVNISQESLHLKIRGAIYAANGTMLYNNQTVFTPYVTLQSMTLVIGQNVLAQPGYVIVWGSASSLSAYDHLSNLKYVPLAAGDYFVIEEMTRDNVPVTEAELKVTTVQYVIYDEFGGVDMPQGASDAEWLIAHWYWFALIAGVICCLAWIVTRNNVIGIAGIILVLVGGVFWILSDASSTLGLLSGLFDIKRGGP